MRQLKIKEIERIEATDVPGTMLVIGEDWCGPCSWTCCCDTCGPCSFTG